MCVTVCVCVHEVERVRGRDAQKQLTIFLLNFVCALKAMDPLLKYLLTLMNDKRAWRTRLAFFKAAKVGLTAVNLLIPLLQDRQTDTHTHTQTDLRTDTYTYTRTYTYTYTYTYTRTHTACIISCLAPPPLCSPMPRFLHMLHIAAGCRPLYHHNCAAGVCAAAV